MNKEILSKLYRFKITNNCCSDFKDKFIKQATVAFFGSFVHNRLKSSYSAFCGPNAARAAVVLLQVPALQTRRLSDHSVPT